jgi:ABC-type sugar transport system substrate-binding protein
MVSRRTLLAAGPLVLAGCASSTKQEPTIGVAFETLQTEYWVASRNAIEAELKERNIKMLEAIADGDANRQFEQVRNFIARKVDGIIIVPKDAQTVIPMIREANQANTPIVLFNRPPAKSDAKSVTVVADNYSIAKDTVAYLAEQAMKAGKTHKAAILIGDLGDINAIGRRDGFDDALKVHGDAFQVVARIPTEWNQEKALAGLTNALQANRDIDFVFTSSDLLLPSVASALKSAGKWKKYNEPGHVFLGGFDGDATAYRMLRDGYVDAIGVQDVYFDTEKTVQAVLDLKAGKPVPETIVDKGFVMSRDNADQTADRMWGAKLATR